MSPTPPVFEVNELRDVGELNDVLTHWRIRSLQLGNGRLPTVCQRIVFDDLVIEQSVQNVSKRDEYLVPSNATVICLFPGSPQRGHWCGFEVPEDVILINQAEYEHFAVLPKHFQHISIAIDNSTLESWDILPHSLIDSGGATAANLIPLTPASHHFRTWLFKVFDSPVRLSGLCQHPEETMLFRERLQTGLANAIRSGLAARGDVPNSTRPARRFPIAQRASEIIYYRIKETISPEELASEVGVTARTLQRSFTDVFGITPYKFTLLAKLNAVRSELRKSTKKRTVSQVAAKYGFTELGRFSARYRSLFDELPSETLNESS